jgi:cell division control protein 24
MISALNPLRLLEPRSGVQVYPPPGQAAANRRLNLSLFQYCSLVRSRLERDHVFSRFLNQVASEPNFDSSDPVSHLWDCFCVGLPLCYLYNRVIGTLPRRHAPLDVDREQTITQSLLEAERAKTEAVAMFCMGVTELNPEWSLGVSDIVNDRVSLDGFMKVKHS